MAQGEEFKNTLLQGEFCNEYDYELLLHDFVYYEIHFILIFQFFLLDLEQMICINILIFSKKYNYFGKYLS